MTAFIVGLSIAFAALFTVARWFSPTLRRQIEQPKYNFQQQLQRYDQHRHEKPVVENGAGNNEHRNTDA